MNERYSRIESKPEVQAYLQNLKYALNHGAQITLLTKRKVDENRDIRYTNGYTINDLFPEENPKEAIRREIASLTVEEYLRTVKDINRPNKSEMREFGRVYQGKGDVYIKIRVDVISNDGSMTVLTMSFHYAEKPFEFEVFPYKK